MNPGDKLGAYEILEPLGAGGMGEVYRARDPRLDRDAAIKVLPEDFAADPERLARFEREAKLLAQLNHSNIAGIYGLEEADGTRFIAMECVEGETLAERLVASGRIEVDEALDIARQIAEALEAAHESGIIHRDLKPANAKITSDGKVKVLDFGLAKAWDLSGASGSGGGSASLSPDLSHSPTMMDATRAGVILGTAAYMSPEQARGKSVDKRTDIWAFGCVLYEILAGKRAFDGDTVSDTMASILKEEPDWAPLRQTPTSIQKLIRRCLRKDLGGRLHDIADARIEIEEASSGDEGLAATMDAPSSRPPFLWAIGGAVLGALVVSLGVWLTAGEGTSETPEITRFAVRVDEGHEMWSAECPSLALSPDGRTLVYATQRGLYVRHFNEHDSRFLEGTFGAQNPFVSPDGNRIGFGRNGTLNTISVDGGAITPIRGARVVYDCTNASWGPDGNIVYRDGGFRHLLRIPAAGGDPTPITEVNFDEAETMHLWPQVVDGGRSVLYTSLGPTGLWEDVKIILHDLETNDRVTVVEQGSYGRYVLTGHVVYADGGGNIYAQPFDVSRRRRTGDPFLLESGVRVALWGGAASFDVSDGGSAVFVHASHDERMVLWWVDRDGDKLQQLGDPMPGGIVMALSPDDRLLLTEVIQPTNGDLWLIDTQTGEPKRFTTHRGYDWTPTFSPDGDRVVYPSQGDEIGYGMYIKAVGDGTPGYKFRDANPASDMWIFSWSVDGWIAFVEAEGGARDLYAVHIDDPNRVIEIAADPEANEWFPSISPDGKWVAFESDTDGATQVYVDSFPEVGNPQQVSVDGGFSPRWSAAGDELFFWTNDQTLMATQVTIGDTFDRRSVPKALFTEPDLRNLVSYDVASDGQRFILSLINRESVPDEIDVTLNFSELLRRQEEGRR